MKTNTSSHIISVPGAAMDATECCCYGVSCGHIHTAKRLLGNWWSCRQKMIWRNGRLNYNQKCSKGEPEEKNLPRLPLQGLKSSTYIQDVPDVAVAAQEWGFRSVATSWADGNGWEEHKEGWEERKREPAAKMSCLGSAHSKAPDSGFECIKENFKRWLACMWSTSTRQVRHLLISIQWKEMGARAAQAEFKCRFVKLGAERTYHQKSSPGVSHTCHHLQSAIKMESFQRSAPGQPWWDAESQGEILWPVSHRG